MQTQFYIFTTLLGQPITVNLDRIISIAPNHNPTQAGTALQYDTEGYIMVRETYQHVIREIQLTARIRNCQYSEREAEAVR